MAVKPFQSSAYKLVMGARDLVNEEADNEDPSDETFDQRKNNLTADQLIDDSRPASKNI